MTTDKIMNKVLTVTVPVYNTEEYLDKCLGSLVVSRELMDILEVLVVIDGSKDNSIVIARKYEMNYPNTFRVIDKENGGHGSCCNVGISEAKGKYIHFLDSDDWFDNQFSSYLMNLKDERADVVFTKRMEEYICEKRRVLHEFKGVKYDNNYPLESLQNAGFAFSIHEVSYSVDLFRMYNVHFREKVSYDDALFSVAGFLGVKKIAFYDMVLYHYLIGRPGQSWDPIVISKHFNDRVLAICDCFNLYEKSINSISKISNKFILRSIGWNLERLYADAWKQNKELAKIRIKTLNESFKKTVVNYSLKMNYLVKIAFYLPFPCGYFFIHSVLNKLFKLR
jgi:glycosyltransferase involved in cell wall biosynthesis